MRTKTSLPQRGFTLIELVVVIIILGILSAVAIPKFISFKADARIAKMKTFAGTLGSAATMATGKWYVLGQPASFTLDDRSVVTVLGGAPTASSMKSLLATPSETDAVSVIVSNGDTEKGSLTLCDMSGGSTACGAGSGYCSVTYQSTPGSSPGYRVDTSNLTTANCQ